MTSWFAESLEEEKQVRSQGKGRTLDRIAVPTTSGLGVSTTAKIEAGIPL
jgi:hypothetical protein